MFEGCGFFGRHRVSALCSNRKETLLRRVCRLLIFFTGLASPLSRFVSPLRKYSCPRVYVLVWNALVAFVLCLYTLNPGIGLSFPRMKGDGYCSRLEVFLLLCFPFFESCIRSNVFGFVVLHLWIWRNIKFWKMKGGRYCLEIGSFIGSFFFQISFVSRHIDCVTPFNLRKMKFWKTRGDKYLIDLWRRDKILTYW